MSADPAPLPTRASPSRREATRRRVLDAAVACIVEEGFQASNLARIAARAGVTTGAIQHQFGDKATLLAEVVERGYERMVDRLARLPAVAPCLEARVPEVIGALWQGYEAGSTRASLEILLATRGDAAFHRRSVAFLEATHARIDRLWMGTFWDAPCGRAGHVAAQRTAFPTLNGLALERMLVPGMPDPAPDLARLSRQVYALLAAEERGTEE